MATGDSIIRVSIIGDAHGLQTTLGKVDGTLGSLGKTFGKLALIGGAVGGAAAIIKEGFDFTQDSLNKADDFNDKLSTLSKLTTPAFANHLHDVAFGLSDIGLSAVEVADAANAFAAFATAAKVSEPVIESLTPKLLDVAEAISLKTGKPLDEVINDIGKAASGNKKSVADLGVVVDKTLNPDQQITSILDQLVTLYGDANSAAQDLDGTQDKINAKIENFQVKLGEALDGPLNSIAGIGLEILDELADWPGAIAQFFGAIESGIRTVAAPLGNLRDLLGGIDDLLHSIGGGSTPQTPGQRDLGNVGQNLPGEGFLAAQERRRRERNGLFSTLGL